MHAALWPGAVHYSHRLRICTVHDGSTASLVYCVRCGAYCEHRVKNLRRKCEGHLGTTEVPTSWLLYERTIAKGRHPSRKAALGKPRRALPRLAAPVADAGLTKRKAPKVAHAAPYVSAPLSVARLADRDPLRMHPAASATASTGQQPPPPPEPPDDFGDDGLPPQWELDRFDELIRDDVQLVQDVQNHGVDGEIPPDWTLDEVIAAFGDV